jgi:isopropylmalate/homocitrate/citramalate synthase
MDALALVDTFGVTSPHAMQYLVREVRKRINKRLEAHFHMDFGMGVANTVMAVAEGVEVIHSTVLGIGERAGNTPMEETVLALLAMYGVDCGVRYEKLCELAQMVHEMSGHPIAGNRPVVGPNLFDIESGIIASWWKNCGDTAPTEIFPFLWDVVGNNPGRVVMGRGSGLDSIKVWLQKTGREGTEEQVTQILTEVKKFGYAHKRLLTESEFCELADSVLHPVLAH